MLTLYSIAIQVQHRYPRNAPAIETTASLEKPHCRTPTSPTTSDAVPSAWQAHWAVDMRRPAHGYGAVRDVVEV